MGAVVVRELSVRTELAVLRRAEVSVPSGGVVAVVGDATATALVRAVAGVVVSASGSVRVGGEELTGLSAADVAARGIVLVPAGWTAFGALTVAENVLVGARGDAGAATEALGRLPRLATAAVGQPPAPARAGALPAAEVRALAVAVALARRPRVLLVERLAVAGPDVSRAVLAAVRAAGVTAVVAERATFAGRGIVLPDGFQARDYDRVFVARGGAVRPWRPAEA